MLFVSVHWPYYVADLLHNDFLSAHDIESGCHGLYRTARQVINYRIGRAAGDLSDNRFDSRRGYFYRIACTSQTATGIGGMNGITSGLLDVECRGG